MIFALAGARAAAPPRLDDPIEGRKLAQEMRVTAPAEAATFRGLLRISAPGSEPRERPVETQVTPGKDGWSAVYRAKLANGETEILTVRHFANRPNEYEWQHNHGRQQPNGSALTNHFAGSDFSLLDLGLEFFHWPTQTLVTREMRKGRGCDVLESRGGPANSYSRVLSWIDQDSRAQGQPGLLMAEAYDARGKLLKEFEIKGFKNGQVTDMEIRNRQTKTSTRLQFSLDEK